MELDYQQVIEMVATIISVALPIGIILSLSEWAVKFFIDCVLGRWKKLNG